MNFPGGDREGEEDLSPTAQTGEKSDGRGERHLTRNPRHDGPTYSHPRT